MKFRNAFGPIFGVLLGCVMALTASSCLKSTGASFKPQDEVQYLDSDIFDQDLSAALSGGQEKITATLPEVGIKISDKFPQRLDKWLYMVKTSNGKVMLEAEGGYSKDRSIPFWIKDIVTGIYDTAKEMALYAPAKNYNATLYYERGTGQVRKIVFTRK